MEPNASANHAIAARRHLDRPEVLEPEPPCGCCGGTLGTWGGILEAICASGSEGLDPGLNSRCCPAVTTQDSFVLVFLSSTSPLTTRTAIEFVPRTAMCPAAGPLAIISTSPPLTVIEIPFTVEKPTVPESSA